MNMTTRTYDLSENVVPHDGEEAIADTPSTESPSATTDEKRGEEKTTDPTSLDSNPENEDETRNADDRVDVTSLANRRARHKRSTPIPKLSGREFSDVLKWINVTASENPHADFGKVVVSGVREFAYKANKNSLNVLAAVVPSLLSSGNFDLKDRQSLFDLNKQVLAQRKQADDPAGAVTSDPLSGGAAAGAGAVEDAQAGGTTIPSDPGGIGEAMGGSAGGATIPSDPGGIGEALGDVGAGLGEGLSNAGSGLADAAGQAVSDVGAGLGTGVQNGLETMGLGGVPQGISEAVGGISQGIDTIQNNGAPPAPGGDAGQTPAPIGAPTDPGAQGINQQTPVNLASRTVKRGRTVKRADGGGTLHFDHGQGGPPVPVQHLQDHGDGTSMIQNEMGQPEAVNNEDLYHDPTMQMPVTQPHPKDQLPPTSPQAPPAGGPPPGGAPPAPPKAPPPPGGGGDAPKPPLSDDDKPDRGSSADETPHKDDDSGGDDKPKKTQNPYNSNRRRAGDDTNADGADPEDVRAENEDNTVDPTKSAAFSRRRRTAEDNLDAAKSDTDTQDVEKPIKDTSDRAQQTQYDRGEYDQNGPLLTDPDKSTDQNWPPKASAVDAIRLADMYVDFGLISPEQKYQVVAGFEKMNGFIVKDRLKVLTAVAATRKTTDKNRALVPQSNGKMPSMGRGSSLKEASKNSDFDHFLAL